MRRLPPPKFLLAGGVLVAAIAYLVTTAVQSTAVYYLTVSELIAAGPSVYGQAIRVSGNVVPGSIQRDTASFSVQFEAEDESGRLPVVYKGVLPDIFGDGVQVVVEGKYAPGAPFAANTLLAKCPSKFES